VSADQYYVETVPFRAFVHEVVAIVERESSPVTAIAALREPFGALLRDDQWLPEPFAVPAERSGMGGGIGSYLLFRTAARDLTLTSLVVRAGAQTPVHDHLAWGLVGLYRGEQSEEVFSWQGELRLTERRHLRRGDFYELIPPAGDIHRVVAASEQPSVSIHLLRNDVGCVHRHQFEPNEIKAFRSGYVNVECET
jgi:predicted metal-dependent enzyme (double-stranded beta helix superfamily)